jgi:hypothetical protein
MLLSSQAFAGFLQELNQTGSPETARPQARQEGAQAQPHPARKDINPHKAARQLQSQQPQVGMAFVPEPNVDLSLFDTPSWNSAVPSTDYHVFAVTEVPQGPVLDLLPCSGKTKMNTTSTANEKTLPSLAEVPEQVEAVVMMDKMEASEQTVPTMVQSTTRSVLTATVLRPSSAMPVFNPKSALATQLAKTKIDDAGDDSWEHLHTLCSDLEATVKRLATLIPGME